MVNAAGIYFAASTFFWAVAFYPPLVAAWVWSLAFDRKRRRAVDWVVHAWAKVTMLACLCRPTGTASVCALLPRVMPLGSPIFDIRLTPWRALCGDFGC